MWTLKRVHRITAMAGLLIAIGCERTPADSGTGTLPDDHSITFYRLRSPGDAFDIEQASGLDFGRIGEREGLWLVCDRNGGESAGRLFFISSRTLKGAKHGETIVADETFDIVRPDVEWRAFVAEQKLQRAEVGDDVFRRLNTRLGGGAGPFLDLEAVAIVPSPSPPHEPCILVSAEEPFSTVLELRLEEVGPRTVARLAAIYDYFEAETAHGSDRNDGLEGLAPGGRPGEIYFCEEGTRSHGGRMGDRLFFLDPLLGVARLTDGRVEVHASRSEVLTQAVHGQRDGDTQTLNALARGPDGELLAVDRNGGWILQVHVGPTAPTATRWLNLYDIDGLNLRKALADFPGSRQMPYISIEGIAVDNEGSLWLIDDPAMPESFRASCLIRIQDRFSTTRPANGD